MKKVTLLYLLVTCLTGFSQFGFERISDITVTNAEGIQKFPWAGGMDYCQFSNIDLDFDGVEDLFVFDRTTNKVLTFLQKGGVGEADYEYAPEYEAIFPDDLVDWVLLVDYNCDGKKDIFANAIGSGKVYLNVGNEIDGNIFELETPLLRTTIYGGSTFMFLNSVDVPAVVDVDGDGDIDILSFSLPGTTIEYQKNLSMETYGICDSLIFETKNICWGRFKENGVSNEVSLWDTLTAPCTSDDLTEEAPFEIVDDRSDRHSGSTVLALDLTNSGVMDLVLGDVSYNNLVMLLNSGSAPNTNSGMYFQDTAFPSTSVSVDLPLFPAAFHVDINNDGIRDLMVSPNSKIGSENRRGMWYYKNENEDLEPDFVYQEDAFLQDQMIDQGSSSLPVFFDHNGDGLLDLLVSSFGQYDPVTNSQISKIAYYQNVGTATVPDFELITDDYQDISTLDLGASLGFYPTFGDLDGDGDEDMILGEVTGYCYYSENTGGPGSEAIFNTFTLLTNSEGGVIFEGSNVYPQLVDLDRDGDQDLVIGRRTGKLQYFNNTGVGTYNFEFVTNELGGVNVSAYNSPNGHAVPQFVDIDGEYELVIGSTRGTLHYYTAIDDNIDGVFFPVDSTLDNIYIGTFSAPAIVDLNGDNKLDMMLGNKRGGVAHYSSAAISDIGLPEVIAEDNILIYPNPAEASVIIELNNMDNQNWDKVTIYVYSITGELITQLTPNSNLTELDVSTYSAGTYLINWVDGSQSIQKKMVVK